MSSFTPHQHHSPSTTSDPAHHSSGPKPESPSVSNTRNLPSPDSDSGSDSSLQDSQEPVPPLNPHNASSSPDALDPHHKFTQSTTPPSPPSSGLPPPVAVQPNPTPSSPNYAGSIHPDPTHSHLIHTNPIDSGCIDASSNHSSSNHSNSTNSSSTHFIDLDALVTLVHRIVVNYPPPPTPTEPWLARAVLMCPLLDVHPGNLLEVLTQLVGEIDVIAYHPENDGTVVVVFHTATSEEARAARE